MVTQAVQGVQFISHSSPTVSLTSARNPLWASPEPSMSLWVFYSLVAEGGPSLGQQPVLPPVFGPYQIELGAARRRGGLSRTALPLSLGPLHDCF